MDNLGKIGRSLMDNWGGGGGIRQLINILFCGYRRLEIGDCRSMMPKPILVWGTGAPASNYNRNTPFPVLSHSFAGRYNLRGSSTGLFIPRPRTEFLKKESFSYSGAKLWNRIPENIRNSISYNSFCKILFSSPSASQLLN